MAESYYGTTQSGQDVYLDAQGNMVDENGNSVSVSGALDTSGASMSSVTANPTIQPATHDSTTSDISQLANVAGQWGATIAGIVSNTPVQVTSKGATTGVKGVSGFPMSTGSGSLLLIIIVVVVVILATRK
jgi:hypothetical protein